MCPIIASITTSVNECNVCAHMLHWDDYFEFRPVGWHCSDNHPRQIFCWSIQWFRSSGTPNFTILHWLSLSPLQQCKQYHGTLIYKFLAVTWSTYTAVMNFRLYTRVAQVSQAAAKQARWQVVTTMHLTTTSITVKHLPQQLHPSTPFIWWLCSKNDSFLARLCRQVAIIWNA